MNQIFPLRDELSGSTGIVVKIYAPDGVLHHVLHNPVGREDLCGSRNLVSLELALLGKHLVLALRDIELIEPANQFWRTEVIVGDEFRMAGLRPTLFPLGRTSELALLSLTQSVKHIDESTFRQDVVG